MNCDSIIDATPFTGTITIYDKTQNMSKRWVLDFMLVMTLILGVSFVYALDPGKPVEFYRHNVWTAEDGLPMNTVISITQTPDGYIWLGTETGLVRFDGLEFDVFSSENTPELLNNLILSLHSGQGGELWIGTRGGGITCFQDETFHTMTTRDGLLDNEVWTIMETGDGAVWIGTRNGLNRFHEGKLSTIPLPDELPSYNVRALMEDRRGRVWVGTYGAGVIQVNKKGNRFEAKQKALPGYKISSLLQDRKGNVWAGSVESGLILLENGKPPHIYNKTNGLTTNYIICLWEDRSGNLWIGTYGGGICILKSGEGNFTYFSNRDGLSSMTIDAFYEDREGLLWIGTMGGGLNCLGDTRITTYTMKHGLSYDDISAIYQDSRQNIWIGNMGSGVDYIPVGNGQIQSISTGSGLSTNCVVSITENPAGFLWFGTLGGGVNRMNIKNGTFDVFTTSEGLSDNFVRALYTDPSGNLWAGTDKGTVHRFINGWFVLYLDVGFRVNTIYKDSGGCIWTGTWGGGLHSLQNGDTRSYTKENGLSGNIVISIYESDKGTLWIGTYGSGLNYFRNGKIKKIRKKDGLPDNTVYCILEDRDRYLWFSSNRGIYRVQRDELDDFVNGKISRISPSLFTTEDGMKSVECNGGFQPAGCIAHDGKLWLPTTKGVSVLDPENMGIHSLPPPVQIKKAVIDGIPYPTGKRADAPPGKGSLEIHYTGLSYVVPRKIRFSYKIEGLDEQWVDAGTGRRVNYIGIPPGTYRFRVIARNSDGIWNNNGASFDFTIKPRYYQTLGFKIGFPIGLLLIILSLYILVKKLLAIRALKQKYKNSHLGPDESREYLQKILYQLEVEKIYRDEHISLHTLAEKLTINTRYLSQIINEQLGKHFQELINQYRVKEAQDLLLSPRQDHKSVLEIGYEVGFNSKSAFNRSFKHFTGMTPTQFKRKHDNRAAG